MSDGRLNAEVDQYLQAAAMNTPPPTIVSDPLVTGVTPIEQLLRVLGIAANLGDATDNARSAEQHAEREAKMTEAAAKFAAHDEQAAAELDSITAEPGLAPGTAPDGITTGQEQTAAAAQQLPQTASSVAGALAGAIGGALQPLAQLPQQVAQGIQQAMQAGAGLLQQAGGAGIREPMGTDLATSPLPEDLGIDTADPDYLAGAGSGSGLGLGGGGLGALNSTAPTGYLGPPPVPPSSVSTAPSSAPITTVGPPGATAVHAPGGTGMGAMPLVPPGALGAAANAGKDEKTDTKRVSVPPVRNGAPVQGRLTVPPEAPPATKKVDGTPVVTRRIAGPRDAQSAGSGS